MDPNDFLTLAERLVIEGPKAANLRTATSRAYYATHHFGSHVLNALQLPVPHNQHAHSEVAALLQHAGDEDIEAVGTMLNDLYSARLKADYQLQNKTAELHGTVVAHVKQARKMITSLEGCLAEPKRSKVSASIRAWDKHRKEALAAVRNPK